MPKSADKILSVP